MMVGPCGLEPQTPWGTVNLSFVSVERAREIYAEAVDLRLLVPAIF
jgi:hypothetical protein